MMTALTLKDVLKNHKAFKGDVMKCNFMLNSLVLAVSLMTSVTSHAAVSLDRTRVIFDGGKKSMTVTVHNYHKTLPFLAQSWIEDAKGAKVTDPLVVVPPIQRIEASQDSALKIQSLPSVSKLPQDRETLFWFNVREIPPRSESANVLQLAAQTKIKMFYRPAALQLDAKGNDSKFQRKVELRKSPDNKFALKNTSAYYVTVVAGTDGAKGASLDGFDVVMLAPFEDVTLPVKASSKKPVFTYVDDYGAQRELAYACDGGVQCTLQDK
ncbi:fimbria/pilus periplasmic chaperone [Aeromonas piscicola]|uniref:fimbria/pilus periplasmic chaperone n=1 Tax=Aeromonas piscicola TaxID=600645 RepID=UPI000693F924|nr:fimbria/pilus periplasmic chaperone [Aeromonas piscicola]